MENRNGSLLNILEVLRDNGISIVVSTLGDTDGFGIYRLICSDTEKAFKVLHEKNLSVTISNVYAIRMPENKPGAAADVVAKITKSGVGIKYMYSFMFGGHGIVVFRADNNDRAEEVVMLEKLDYITEDELKNV